MFKIHRSFLSIRTFKKIKQCLTIIYRVYLEMKVFTHKNSFWNTLCLAERNLLISFQICAGDAATQQLPPSTCTTHGFPPWNLLQSIQRELLFLTLLSSNITSLWHTPRKFLKCQQTPNRSKEIQIPIWKITALAHFSCIQSVLFFHSHVQVPLKQQNKSLVGQK